MKTRGFAVRAAGAAAVLVGMLGASPALAQGVILPHPPRPVPIPRPRPIPPPPPPQPIHVRSQKVTMDVSSGALKVEVEQVFQNPNSFAVEGTYLFPLPAGATVSNFKLQIDREPVQGKMLDRDEARRIYESYVRRNVDPAILEWVGRNAFQAQVFPIPPQGERKIWLTYSQAAEFSGGVYKLVYPLNTERVSGSTAGDLTIDCTIRSNQPLKSIYSPTHEVHVRREGDNRARVSFEGRQVRANRDFLLYYTTSERAFGLNALVHRRPGEDGYVMLMLAPKREVERAEVQPKDVVLVFDTSGSMQGAKIDQARRAALTILGALNDRDRFNVIRFSSDVSSFRQSVVPANRENVEAAKAFVNEFRAVGGTAIDDALQAGLASLPKEADRGGRPPFLIFMTDGLPTVGVTEVDRILDGARKAAPPDLRLFPFGVGADVNTLLLDRLALDNRGSADYVDASEDLETKIGSFYAKIADPVLANVRLTVEGASLVDTYPNKIPDLFAGTQLLVLGRYRTPAKVRVTLSGDLNGRPQRYTYDAELADRELDHDFIPKLWAGRRIGFLLEEIRLKGENKELKDEVIRLSKEHGIVTPYTSYLVEEPGLLPPAPAGARLEDRFSLHREPASGPRGPAGPPGPTGGVGGGGGFGGQAGAPTDTKSRLAQEAQKRANASRQQAYGYNQSSGWNAVEASRRLRDLKEKVQAEDEVESLRTVQGRAFRYEKGIWIDETSVPRTSGKPAPASRTVQVRYGSEAYFKLIAHRTDWAKWLSVGKQVRLRTGPTTLVEVGEKGKERLTDAEVKALER